MTTDTFFSIIDKLGIPIHPINVSVDITVDDDGWTLDGTPPPNVSGSFTCMYENPDDLPKSVVQYSFTKFILENVVREEITYTPGVSKIDLTPTDFIR